MQEATHNREEFWFTYVDGNQSDSHAALARELRVPSDEAVLCDELVNQSWLLRALSRLLPGHFDFESGYRLIVTDKRILLSKYGGLSSWLVQNIPGHSVTAFFRERNSGDGSGHVIEAGSIKFSFDVSRKRRSTIASAMSSACPSARSEPTKPHERVKDLEALVASLRKRIQELEAGRE
ncbi:MAG: hypothetical protein ABUT39_10420 [Acidobacteriota bacterium]